MVERNRQLSENALLAGAAFDKKWGIPEHDLKHLKKILVEHLKYTDDIDGLGFDSLVNDGISLYKSQASPEIATLDLFSYKNKLREAVLDFADQYNA